MSRLSGAIHSVDRIGRPLIPAFAQTAGDIGDERRDGGDLVCPNHESHRGLCTGGYTTYPYLTRMMGGGVVRRSHS